MAETPGHILSAARQSCALTHEDIAKQLRLSVQSIRDIESDHYDRFGSVTFVRGYLRSYARVVDVPEDKILTAWEIMTTSVKLMTPAPSVVSHQSDCKKAPLHRLSYVPSRMIIALGILTVLCVLMWWVNQKPTPIAHVQSSVYSMQTPVTTKTVIALPVNITDNTTRAITQPVQASVSKKSIVKQKKHHTLAHHHSEIPLHVTYTIKPVSSTELAADH